MRNKQILIEKYIEPSETHNSLSYTAEYWADINGDNHSFMGHPAVVIYNNKEISSQFWFKKSLAHREKNLPASIFYKNGQAIGKEWHKNGEYINMEIY
jgi:hypothetical protein